MSKQEPDSKRTPPKYGRARGSGDSAHGAAALEDVNANHFQECVVAVLAAGDAIAFGLTKDGGAVAITVYSDGEAEKLYGSDADDLTEIVESVTSIARSH